MSGCAAATSTPRALLTRGVRVLAHLAGTAPVLRDQYRAAMPDLTSRKNWDRLFAQG